MAKQNYPKRFKVFVNGSSKPDDFYATPKTAEERANGYIKRGKGTFWVQVKDTLANNRVIGESRSNEKIKLPNIRLFEE